MMLEIVAYISHPMRGRLDILAVRNLLDAGRKKLRQPRRDREPSVRLIAPYLLHAQVLRTPALVIQHRIDRLTWKGGIPYTELHLHGDEICDAMQTEICHARSCGIKVVAHGVAESILEEFNRQSAHVAA